VSYSEGVLSFLKLMRRGLLPLRQTSDTIRGKKSGLKKFFVWCLTQNIRYIDDVTLDLMGSYMVYLNRYRQVLKDAPLCLAQKRNLLTFVKHL